MLIATGTFTEIIQPVMEPMCEGSNWREAFTKSYNDYHQCVGKVGILEETQYRMIFEINDVYHMNTRMVSYLLGSPAFTAAGLSINYDKDGKFMFVNHDFKHLKLKDLGAGVHRIAVVGNKEDLGKTGLLGACTENNQKRTIHGHYEGDLSGVFYENIDTPAEIKPETSDY